MALCGVVKEHEFEGKEQGRVGWLLQMVEGTGHGLHSGFSSRNGGSRESILGFMVGMG
jgi:hypothetical protein